jgi:hypothetical protein
MHAKAIQRAALIALRRAKNLQGRSVMKLVRILLTSPVFALAIAAIS